MTHREFQRLADEAKGRLKERGYGSRIYIKNMPGLDLSLDEYRPVYTVFIGDLEAMDELDELFTDLDHNELLSWMLENHCNGRVLFGSDEDFSEVYIRTWNNRFFSVDCLLSDEIAYLPFIVTVETEKDPFTNWDDMGDLLSEVANHLLGSHLEESMNQLEEEMRSFEDRETGID